MLTIREEEKKNEKPQAATLDDLYLCVRNNNITKPLSGTSLFGILTPPRSGCLVYRN